MYNIKYNSHSESNNLKWNCKYIHDSHTCKFCEFDCEFALRIFVLHEIALNMNYKNPIQCEWMSQINDLIRYFPKFTYYFCCYADFSLAPYNKNTM